VRALRRAPNPRLTALGAGLFCIASMMLVGLLDRFATGSSMVVYGVLFLPVSTLTALWVRRADLVAAPVAVPIAFAAGALLMTGGSGGLGGRAVGLFTALALYAGWLYGGTLVAGLIATVRRIRLIRQLNRARAAERRAAAQRARRPGAGNVPRPGSGGRDVPRPGVRARAGMRSAPAGAGQGGAGGGRAASGRAAGERPVPPGPPGQRRTAG
jgi:hypothetical protein